jgi:hypothetical protein
MSLIGFPDLDRPVSFSSGALFHPFGGGAFRLQPFRSAVATAADGTVEFGLDLVRAISSRDSHAMLAATLSPEYASQDALARVRAIDPLATLSPCVSTDWWFRLAATPGVQLPPELTQPVLLASNGLGTARLAATLSIDSGLMLEAMLRERTPLTATAEARLEGVSPRVPVVVRFDAAALLRELLALANEQGQLARQAIVACFARDPVTLPLAISDDVGPDYAGRFAETMADRIIARFGGYVPSDSGDMAPTVRLAAPPAATTITWALMQPVLAQRQVVLPVDLLSAAQAQVSRLGIDSIVRRDTLASLPPLGQARVTALCNLPAARSGVDALGVTLTFPPHPPQRPQARTATAVFEPPDDLATVALMLSPGEPLEYRYATFAVISDEQGTRQLDGAESAASGSTLRLSPAEFPVKLALVEVTPALGQLAVVSGVCSYVLEGRTHQRAFTLDSGQASIGLAIPAEATEPRINFMATARDGSGTLMAGAFESLEVRLDVTSFPTYGPQQADVRCVFDDGAPMRALSLLPRGAVEADENITTFSFTPAEPLRTFRWFASSPFSPGFRYRAFDPTGGAWTDAPAGPLVVYSSQLRKREVIREVLARSGHAIRESVPRRPGRVLESAAAGPATPETAVQPVATSPAAMPTDELLYARIVDPAKKLYVPRYALDVQVVSGQQRYRISMIQGQTASTLEVNLVAAVAPALAQSAGDAAEYPHDLTIRLEYLIAPPAGATKSLEFGEVTRNGAIVKATLTFATLQERDEVYRAITETERHARLVVERFIDVSLPQAGGSGPLLPGGFLTFLLPPRPIAATVNPGIKMVALLKTPLAATAMAPAVTVARVAALAPSRRETVMLSAMAPVSVVATATAAPARILRSPVSRFVKSLPEPKLAFTGMQVEGVLARYRLCVQNWDEFPDELFAPAEDLPPFGVTKAASRTWVAVVDADTKARLYSFGAIASARQLAELAFTLPAARGAPKQVSITLTDRRVNVVRESNAVSTAVPAASAPPYLAVRSRLEQSVPPEPFAFAPALHGYIYQGLTPAGGDSGLVRYRFAWRGTFHTYLQDASRPSLVYCFADRFKIARRAEAPFTPFITVRVASHPDGSGADVVFDYVVAPYTDPRRLDDARAQLLADPRFSAADVQFQPFASSDVRYFIDRPSQAGAVREERIDAALVLQGALKDTLTMTLPDFQLVFDAMQHRTASMFAGRVEIDVPHADTEVIPFEARVDDLAGEIFSYEAATGSDGKLQVTVTNEIESPLNVQTLDATIVQAGRRIRGVTQGAGLPCSSLLPGDAIQVTVTPETALAGAATPEVSFDLGGVTVVPDVEAIWNSILDRSTTDYFRIVTVKAVASSFEPAAGGEDAKIVSLVAEFEGGGTAELNATTLSAQVRVDYPIDDVILRRPVSMTYRYTVTIVRKNGVQERDAQPRQSSADLFYVSVVR